MELKYRNEKASAAPRSVILVDRLPEQIAGARSRASLWDPIVLPRLEDECNTLPEDALQQQVERLKQQVEDLKAAAEET